MTIVELPPLPEHLLRLDATPAEIKDAFMRVISFEVMNDPRSLQEEMGVSEYGTPCTAKLAYMIGKVPQPNPEGVKWRATVGRMIHAGLAEMFMNENARLGYTRYLIEMTVTPGEINGEPLNGHLDIYDRVFRAYVDWKAPGPTTMRKMRVACKAEGPGPDIAYKKQGHGYGRGLVRRGLPVDWVFICFLPAAGELSDIVWWGERYDEQIVIDALARANQIAEMGNKLGFAVVGGMSQRVQDYCEYCEWFSPGNPSPMEGRCPGAPELIAERARELLKAQESPYGGRR